LKLAYPCVTDVRDGRAQREQFGNAFEKQVEIFLQSEDATKV